MLLHVLGGYRLADCCLPRWKAGARQYRQGLGGPKDDVVSIENEDDFVPDTEYPVG
jgi:hypothetical protein